MFSFLLILHVFVCIVLAVVILLQSSKGGGLAGVFGGGGGGMGAVFGGRGAASFLSKLTTTLAIAYMVVALILGLITRPQESKGVVSKALNEGQVTSLSSEITENENEGRLDLGDEEPGTVPVGNEE